LDFVFTLISFVAALPSPADAFGGLQGFRRNEWAEQ
jgi:hypothetical protein